MDLPRCPRHQALGGFSVDVVVVPSAPPSADSKPASETATGYSSLTPGSHSNTGQQSGKLAVLLVFSDSLHLGLDLGYGPQSSTSSNSRSVPSPCTHVERPQNGDSSHVCPGSTVAHLVDAKHSPGKSVGADTQVVVTLLLYICA